MLLYTPCLSQQPAAGTSYSSMTFPLVDISSVDGFQQTFHHVFTRSITFQRATELAQCIAPSRVVSSLSAIRSNRLSDLTIHQSFP